MSGVLLMMGIVLMSQAGVVEVVCHRAANEYAPENTRAATQLCLDWGVDYIEVDVRTSKDGVMYILHDASVDRTTNGHGELSQLTSEEIDALDAGSRFGPQYAGERIPRLEPFLRWVKGKAKVYFDIKRVDIEALVKLIEEVGLEHECFLWSENPAYMKRLCTVAPHLPLKENAYTPESIERSKRDLNVSIVEFGTGQITPEMLATCHRLGVKSMVREARKDLDAFRKIIDAGIDMVNLDHADVFLKLEREMGVIPKK